METKDLDVVYMCRSGENEELLYSIRSVCKNMKFNNLYIVGGKPDNIKPDFFIKTENEKNTKWNIVNENLRLLSSQPVLTDNFILMNDDFFIMDKVNSIYPMYRCTLEEHYKTLERKNGKKNQYTRILRRCEEKLKSEHLPTLSYELHVPIIFNKYKLGEVLNHFNYKCTRSMYSNYYKLYGVKIDDVKVNDIDEIPKFNKFLSTRDETFTGKAKILIKKNFSEKCKYEK